MVLGLEQRALRIEHGQQAVCARAVADFRQLQREARLFQHLFLLQFLPGQTARAFAAAGCGLRTRLFRPG